MAAQLSEPTRPSDIANQRLDSRRAQSSDEERMILALEQIADTTEALRQDFVKFEQMIQRFILSQRRL